MTKINTFLIGVQKGGTTAIYDWLSSHPEVDAPFQLKDYHFFSEEHLFSKGYTHLENFYMASSKLAIHGAANYIFFEEAIKRIKSYNPNARFILFLRNPILRAISAHRYFTQYGTETDSFVNAIKKELQLEKNLMLKANSSYLAHGNYAHQLETFGKYFSLSSLFISTSEQLSQTPEKICNELCSFLKIKNSTHPIKNKNQSGDTKFKNINRILFGKNMLSSVGRQIIPKKIRFRISEFILKNNRKRTKAPLDLNEELRAVMVNYYLQETVKLSDMLNVDYLKLWDLK